MSERVATGGRTPGTVGGANGGTAARRLQAARSKEVILRAALSLIQEVGVRRMTVEAVALRSGVARTTIYRWWRSKGLLALDAFEHGFGILAPFDFPDTGSLRGDLNALMRPVVESVRDTGGDRLGPQIIAEAQFDPELAAQIYSRLIAPYRELHHSLFERAVGRGEISPDVDATMLLDALYGAYFHRILFFHGELDAAFFETLIDTLVSGAQARRT